MLSLDLSSNSPAAGIEEPRGLEVNPPCRVVQRYPGLFRPARTCSSAVCLPEGVPLRHPGWEPQDIQVGLDNARPNQTGDYGAIVPRDDGAASSPITGRKAGVDFYVAMWTIRCKFTGGQRREMNVEGGSPSP